MLQLLYPSDPFSASRPDEAYAEEYEAAKQAGIACSLFSFEDFEAGAFKVRPLLTSDRTLYRGWMLREGAYGRLCESMSGKGSKPFTSPSQYIAAHYLPAWYGLCRDDTPETIVLTASADFSAELAGLGWPSYFVKDYVKSLSTGRGSVAATPAEVGEIVALIAQYRGSLEGGVCVRKFEEFSPGTEERYFALHGVAYARQGEPPALARSLATRIDSPFFAIDLAKTESGEWRLIELGDGQVSDRKLWEAARFAMVLREG